MKLLTVEEFERGSQEQGQQGRFAEGELTFEVKLPSQGRHGYPAVIRCRPLKVKDVKSLIVTEVLNEIEYVKRVIEVLGATIVEPEKFDVREMSWNDFIKLLVAHRVNSIGSIVELNYSCSACGAGNQTVNVDLVELEEVMLGDEYGEDPWVIEGYKYPWKGSQFKFRFPRLSMFWKVGSEIRLLDELSDFDLVRDAYLGDDFEELPYVVYLEALKKIMKFNGYGVKREIDVECKSCGKNVRVVIPFFLFLGQ